MNKVPKNEMVFNESCQWCGNDLTGTHYEHKEWCDKGPRYVYNLFQGLFRDTYNVIELSEDSAKAEKMKDIIGNRIMELRNTLTFGIADYLKTRKWRDPKENI